MKTRILKLLTTAQQGMTHGDIASAIGEPQEHVLQCLFQLRLDFAAMRSMDDRWQLIDVDDPPPKMERWAWGWPQ